MNSAEKVQEEIERQLQEYGHILTTQLLPELNEQGIILYYNSEIKEAHKKEIKELFLSTVLSFIQPLLLNSTAGTNFFPENNQLYFLVLLKSEGHKELTHGIVNIPSDKLPRFYKLSTIDDKDYIIFIDDLIRENINIIFPNFSVEDLYSIKLNRDAELRLEEEMEDDMLKKIEKQLKKRPLGPATRFLYDEAMPKNIQLFLSNLFGMTHEEMFAGGHYHNLKDLATLPVDKKELSYARWKPLTISKLEDFSNIFKVAEERDILLHLPYHSYNPVLSFFNQTAVDPDVKDIYITLYRVATESHILNALISAARNGKNVTAFIELKARFDEENNIRWSRRMKDAGVKILYSQPNIKVHSKTALIVKKREGGERKTYAILSTGNFNETTARFYTDHVLITTNSDINNELLSLFHFLESGKDKFTDGLSFRYLLVSRFNMIERFERLIQAEIDKARQGQPALIRIKINNLEEPHMIDLLYNASREGVKVQLIVRSICCLVPGVADTSQNITIKRIVDRYLEHTRIFIFGEGENTSLMMGSADWMTRNLRRRIEVVAPILDEQCRRELSDYFDLQWKDTDKAVMLTHDMDQIRQREEDNTTLPHNAQAAIYEYLQHSK